MDVILRRTASEATELCARLIESSIRMKPSIALGLATGRTMEPLYARLAQAHARRGLDFSSCTLFALDEYIGLGCSDALSYRRYLDRNLLGLVNANPQKVHTLDGQAEDPRLEALSYEATIAQAGGIDLQLLGLGENGHIAFNEPGSSLASRTREVTLATETLEQNADAFGGDPTMVPERAITVGIGTILESKRALMLVTGESKRQALSLAIEGPIASMVPASALQLHPDCVIIADEKAGELLRRRKQYRSAFERDPTWAPFRGATEGSS